MNVRSISISLMTMAAALACAGCRDVPGRPEPVATRPDQMMNFAVLYKQNCAACHGEDGKSGAAISLANPVYLAVAGTDRIQKATANGVPGTLMPAFAESQGGMLTNQQIAVLTQGLASRWGKADALGGQSAPPYASSSDGDPTQGQAAFGTFCASCHGADGTGLKRKQFQTGSLVDPAYLALISNQGLRSLIIAGQPEDGMPDWRSDMTGAGSRPMTDKEITDVVAWLASHRVAAPGQPYGHP
jgi:cytochrome c oxidase cbb3-type subunit 3/ubiquinol-cytochrome c reductase cytochrome c subunit